MTEKPRAADSAGTAAATSGGSAPKDKAEPRVVIRNKRKIDKTEAPATGTAEENAAESAEGLVQDSEVVVDQVGETVATEESASGAPPVVDAPAEPAEPAEPATPAEEPAERATAPTGLGAELEAVRAELDERTRDLQRVTAEYANYRKRVERDRGVAAEQTTATVLSALLPILDDLDRAREHGDLVGPFGTVAEQLTAALGKFGLTAFGEQGDPFDPTQHEAVAHQTSPDVTEPTCVQVMRRGYLLGERLLRPALVAVADPE